MVQGQETDPTILEPFVCEPDLVAPANKPSTDFIINIVSITHTNLYT